MSNDAGRTKNMMLRLDAELAERLQAVAEVEGRPMADVVREAIAALVEQRRKDRHFLNKLEESLARHQRLLGLLRDSDQ
jgi:predicted DNA-binding protein